MENVTNQKVAITFEQGMENFKTALEKCWLEYYTNMLSIMPIYETSVGKKYTKIISYTSQGKGQRSVWGFIENETGNILKAATWYAPAKGVRGSIYNENPMQGCNEYGPNYMRG